MEQNPIELSIYRDEPGFYCPAAFWPAFGYDNDARFVGIWWDAATDEACWCDGRTGYIGAEPAAYQLLLALNYPPGHPAHWLLGTPTTPASMWLVVERAGGRAWLVAADDAPELLATLNATEEAIDKAADGIGAVVDVSDIRPTARWTARGAWQEPAIDAAGVAAAAEQSAARHAELVAALAVSA
jgi:hypothetical protein